MIDRSSPMFVAGHRGLVGSALVRRLRREGVEPLVRTRQELDLQDPAATRQFFREHRPRYVFLAAARVGGILANDTYPGDFIRENLAIQTSVIESARVEGVEKLLFLGSSCIYPRLCPQPMKEEYLLTGPLEPTNSAYAIAKIAGVMMCDSYRRQYGSNFISVMPTNLYGPGDTFNPETSHVLPALLRKFHSARAAGDREVVVWGSGTPRREFLHVDDLADACLFLMDFYDEGGIVNIGCGEDLSIRDLANLIKQTVGFSGDIVFDNTKPDGPPRKLLDIERLSAMGWRASIPLSDGLESTYHWVLEQGVFESSG